MKDHGAVKVTLSSWGFDEKEQAMTNANALPIQVATDETVSMAHYNAAMDAKQARIDALEKALRASDTALNDWLARYAGEFCEESHVKEADQRISDAGGTLAYIAAVTAENRAALGEGE